MRSKKDREEASRWIAWGLNDCAISRLTGIPRGTIRDWRTSGLGPKIPRDLGCPICSDVPLDEDAYAYLLGLYLGDGCLSEHARGVFRLRITLDQRYPNIIEECRTAIDLVRPRGADANVQQRVGCVEVNAYWTHWPCLFPQHGSGPKKGRAIRLKEWQQAIVTQFPDRLLRGLIHSDGWRGENRVVTRGKPYVYPRYIFVNYSPDVQTIFCRACDDYGVAWRQMRWNAIAISSRSAVERLDEVVGLKS